MGKEKPEEYNQRVKSLVSKIALDNKNMLIIDAGRDIEERSVIWVENGHFRGMGYFDLNFQINNSEVLKSIITPMASNRDATRIIHSFIRRKKFLKLIDLNE